MLTAIPGVSAWKNLLSTPQSRWGWDEEPNVVSESARSRIGRVSPISTITPKFTISPDETFFCIGSCFARNVEEALIEGGVQVTSRKIVCPKDEWPHRPAGLVNKFTSHSILNEVRWAAGESRFTDNLLYQTEGGYVDLQLVPGAKPVNLERAIERRKYIVEDYFPRVFGTDVVVITLGLVEAWYDAEKDTYLNAPPSFWMARKHKDRFQVHVLDYESNLAAITTAIDLINSTGKPKKIVLSVSPVPMGDTFSGEDVIVANMFSKATLRSVAGACKQKFENVDYFPSYENIMLMPVQDAFYDDRQHVRDEVVRDNIALFFRHYMPELRPSSDQFSEVGYLTANPDADDLVRRGLFESGFDHWKKTSGLQPIG